MGIIGQTLAWTFFIIGVELSLIGSCLLCRALWPRRVERAAERCAKRPVWSFIVGAPIAVGTIALSLVVANKAGPAGAVPAFLAITVGFFYASTGIAGLATHVGSRLESPLDDLRPWRPTLRGAIVLAFAYLVPLIGQLAVLPIAIMVGTGANTLSFFARRKPLSPPPLDDTISARMTGGADFATTARHPEEALR